VHRLVSHMVAAPAEAAPAGRVPPVARLRAIAHLERLSRRAAGRLPVGDGRAGGRSLVDSRLGDRPLEQRQPGDVRGCAKRVGINPCERLSVVRGVGLGVPNEPPERGRAQGIQLVEAGALGPAKLRQKREGRTAPHPTPGRRACRAPRRKHLRKHLGSSSTACDKSRLPDCLVGSNGDPKRGFQYVNFFVNRAARAGC